jgi:hypothetical protein
MPTVEKLNMSNIRNLHDRWCCRFLAPPARRDSDLVLKAASSGELDSAIADTVRKFEAQYGRFKSFLELELPGERRRAKKEFTPGGTKKS